MDTRRIEVGGSIALHGEGSQRFLRIVVDNPSVEKWLSLLWAPHFELGEVVVVPRKGSKCTILQIAPEARVETREDGIEMAPSRSLFESMTTFLAAYYFHQGSLDQLDLEVTIDSVPHCGLFLRLEKAWLAPEPGPGETQADTLRIRRR